jgi:hypothetical protein
MRKDFARWAALPLLLVPLGVCFPQAGDGTSPITISPQDRAFLEDLERRSVAYFWEQADHGTGLVLDRSSTDGGRAKGPSRDIASIAATGFGLTAICIGVEHGWIPRDLALERVDFKWMLDGDPLLLSHGWRRGKGFLKYKWNTYNESSLLYLLAIGSPTHPINADSWYAWDRPLYNYDSYHFISGGPLFTHQYSHAWVDFRNRRDRSFVDFYRNSVNATRANRVYCLNLNLPNTFGPDVWGITASDGPRGYRIYGEIKAFEPVDGTVAPSAAGGSLMFTPDISIPALRDMRDRYSDNVYGRYGFVDAYNPSAGWFDNDVVGIDAGIMLLSAENLLTGNVWRWFMANQAISRGFDLAGFSAPPQPEPDPPAKKDPVKKRPTKTRHRAGTKPLH